MLTRTFAEAGSVEGILLRVDAHGERREFVVSETLSGRAIHCSFDDALIRDIAHLRRRRVEVIGTLHYLNDGHPERVDATEIVSFPEPHEIPSIEEMRELLKDA